MGKRAEQVDETRQRIVEATVELHGTVGPAATTIAAIAELANVTRLTVYRHFPDDTALFGACTSQWTSQHPPPATALWTEIADPRERLRTGLSEIYAYYRRGEAMLANVHRDLESIPGEYRRNLDLQDRGFREVLLRAFQPRANEGRTLRAVIGHAVSFATWRSLCREQGLSDAEAVDAMGELVAAAARPDWRKAAHEWRHASAG